MKKIILLSILVIIGLSYFLILRNYSGFSFSRKNLSVEQKNIFQETAAFDAVSFITPHHLLAKDLMENIFGEFSKVNENKPPERIILLSPNHFNVARAPVVIADIKEYNSIIDEPGVKKLLEYNNLFEKENKTLEKDHGIFNILPFCDKYFPRAEIIPLIIRDDISQDKIDKISEILSQNFKEKTIIILSADFSHYIGWPASQMHDQKSIEAISNLDVAKVENLDIDCRGGLKILLNYSKDLGYSYFNLGKNSSSSEILGRDLGEENTSYITGYFSRGDTLFSQPSVDFLFFGDLMLDRYNRVIMEKKGITYPTDKIKRLFWSQEANIANLEGPVTSNDSKSINSQPSESRHLVFTFDPLKTKDFLAYNRINIVNIGNNHMNNFGTGGVIETRQNLEKSGVDYFGNPSSDNNYLEKNINGKKITFINYNEFAGPNLEKTLENIKQTRVKSDWVVVYCHWGKEYETGYTKNQETKGHAFIDAGADVVIGSHPHVVEPLEIYKGKAIFYSLGDFFFDQYFSEDVKNMLAVGVNFSPNSIKLYLIPLYMEKNGQIIISKKERRDILIKRIIASLNIDEKEKDDIISRGIINLHETHNIEHITKRGN